MTEAKLILIFATRAYTTRGINLIYLRFLFSHYRPDGMRNFHLSLMNDGREVDRVNCLSGVLATQAEPFVHPSKDYAGSLRVIPEGVYEIGQHVRGNFGDGIGKDWIPYEVISQYRLNNRGAFGAHDDHNRARALGSAGCTVSDTPAGMQRIIAWCKGPNRPRYLVVDHGLGVLKPEWKFENPGPTPVPTPIPPAPTPGKKLARTGAADAIAKKWEGYHKRLPDGRCAAYPDVAHGWRVATIGYGTTFYSAAALRKFGRKEVRQGDILTEAEAMSEFDAELDMVEAGLAKRLAGVPVTQGMFDAMCSFVFNLGFGGRDVDTGKTNGAFLQIERLRQRKYAECAASFDLYINANGRPYQGLINRRNDEEALFRRDGLTPVSIAQALRESFTLTDEGLVAAPEARMNQATGQWVAAASQADLTPYLAHARAFEDNVDPDGADGDVAPANEISDS